MIRKHSLLLGFSLSAALLLAGCTSDLSQGGRSGEVPLRLSAAPTTGLTRAADGLYTQTSGFDGGEQVEVYVNSNSTHGTYRVNSSTKTGLDAVNDAARLYYPTSGDVSLYAVYPAASIASHTVKYDQTTEENYKASDLMYASKTVTQADKSNNQELQFGHQLVKLKVQIVKAAGVGSVTKVEMQNVKRKVTVAANTSSMTLTDLTSASGETGTGANEDKILVFSGSNTQTSTQTYAVVFPVQEWADQDFITVTADDQTATYKLTKNDFTFGHEYTLTLNINARALGNTVSIDTWSNGGSAVINPTASELYIEDITPVVYNGSARKPSFTIKDAEDHTVATITDGNSTSDFDITWQNNTNAGTATVAAVGKSGTDYAGKACAKNFTIQKAPGSISYGTSAVEKTYGNVAFTNTLTATSGTGIGTVTYSSSNEAVASVNESSGQVTIQKAGSATITATVVDGANYSYATKTASYTLTVAKATPSVTAPTAKSGLVYSGSAQQLINAGSTTGGTLKYSLDNSTWYDAATSITGTVAQTYTVYYKVVGNDNYNDVASASITATIVSYPNASAATSSDIGKIVCNSGHIHSSKSDVTSAKCTAVGVIVYVDQSGTGDDEITEKTNGFGHTLVMALTNTTSKQQWGGYGTDESYLTNTSSIDGCKSNNVSGLTNTTNLGSGHAAANSTSSYTPAAPTSYGSSRWFLPSAAQWIAAVKSWTGNSYVDPSWGGWNNVAASYSNMKTMVEDAGGTALATDDYYWSSSEYNANRAVYVNFSSSNGFLVYSDYKNYSYCVRPFLAF